MKIPAKLALTSCFATLAATSLAFAGGGAPGGIVAIECAPIDPQPEDISIIECPSPIEEPVIDKSDDGTGSEEATAEDEGGSDSEIVKDKGDSETTDSETTDSETTDADNDGGGKGTGAPNELERGGEVQDVILYNMAGGAPAAVSLGKPTLQNDRGADIERKQAAVVPVSREKKAPVALIKKGRIFLR